MESVRLRELGITQPSKDGPWSIDNRDRDELNLPHPSKHTYNDKLPWCLQPYLLDLKIVVPRTGIELKRSNGSSGKEKLKEHLTTIQQVRTKTGVASVHRIVKGKRQAQPLVPSQVQLKHPGPKPADGHCWFVFRGDSLGNFVRPIRWVDMLVSGVKKPAWMVAVVKRRGPGKADEITDQRCTVLNENLIILERATDWQETDKEVMALREKSRQGSAKKTISAP